MDHKVFLFFVFCFFWGLPYWQCCCYVVAKSCPLFCKPMGCSHQAPLSMRFPKQDYWSVLPFPSPGHFHDPEIEPASSVSAEESLSLRHWGSPIATVLIYIPSDSARVPFCTSSQPLHFVFLIIAILTYARWCLIIVLICMVLISYDAGRDWGQEEKGTTEDEMAGWHHWLDGCESEWTLGVGDGQEGLVCCNSWGRKESDTTEQLIWSDLIWTPYQIYDLKIFSHSTGQLFILLVVSFAMQKHFNLMQFYFVAYAFCVISKKLIVQISVKNHFS